MKSYQDIRDRVIEECLQDSPGTEGLQPKIHVMKKLLGTALFKELDKGTDAAESYIEKIRKESPEKADKLKGNLVTALTYVHVVKKGMLVPNGSIDPIKMADALLSTYQWSAAGVFHDVVVDHKDRKKTRKMFKEISPKDVAGIIEDMFSHYWENALKPTEKEADWEKRIQLRTEKSVAAFEKILEEELGVKKQKSK